MPRGFLGSIGVSPGIGASSELGSGMYPKREASKVYVLTSGEIELQKYRLTDPSFSSSLL